MKFKIKKDTILGALSKVQAISGKKTNMPVTSNVVISANASMISLFATDLEIAFEGTYEAEVFNEGSTLVPSRKVYEIIRNFPKETVTLEELENKWIKIVDDQIEFKIVGMDPEDFPGLPDIGEAKLFEMDSEVLRDMVDKTLYAVLSDESRAHLAGVYVETFVEGGETGLRMVSTDGHRLSKIDHPFPTQRQDSDGGFHLEKGIIIPRSGMTEIIRLIEGKASVRFGVKDNNFIVKSENEGLVVRLIEGEFPDYRLVIPKKTRSEVRVDKDALVMMLKRMSILSTDKYRGVRFKIRKDSLESSTTNPEIGESKETISVDFTGEDFEVAFNGRYFVEALNSMKSKNVTVKFNDEVNPCALEGVDDPGFLSVIMPMRV